MQSRHNFPNHLHIVTVVNRLVLDHLQNAPVVHHVRLGHGAPQLRVYNFDDDAFQLCLELRGMPCAGMALRTVCHRPACCNESH
jgi:hypothetical protein